MDERHSQEIGEKRSPKRGNEIFAVPKIDDEVVACLQAASLKGEGEPLRVLQRVPIGYGRESAMSYCVDELAFGKSIDRVEEGVSQCGIGDSVCRLAARNGGCHGR
ncbi:MAG: hypothetical protein BGN84_03810 [Afipia sp. 62-7]|nr:MAG: hypothetical protein BGN84_03810 [Afipia sp. 62-7]